MRYYSTFRQFLKKQFPGESVFKIPIDAGFTCPNRDGTVGVGGCLYCENRSFSPNSGRSELDPRRQIEDGMAFYKENFGATKFIAYFQAYSNTYAPIDKLKAIYDSVRSFDDVIGISIGTRPDCAGNDVLDLVESYAHDYHVWMEYGLQSANDSTLELINRGHSFEQFTSAVARTKERDSIRVCAHVILGLPGETRETMLDTAAKVAETGVDGVKIHHLYIARNTVLEKMFEEKKISVMSLQDFVSTAVEFLAVLPEDVVIQRLVGEISGDFLVAPKWHKSKNEILKLIDEEFRAKSLRQGKNAAGKAIFVS